MAMSADHTTSTERSAPHGGAICTVAARRSDLHRTEERSAPWLHRGAICTVEERSAPHGGAICSGARPQASSHSDQRWCLAGPCAETAGLGRRIRRCRVSSPLLSLPLSSKPLNPPLKAAIAATWNVKKICFEYDTDPYYQALDMKVKNYVSSAGIEVFSPVSHTLFNPADIIQKDEMDRRIRELTIELNNDRQ
ncbi:hypothetical protein EZV62_003930 [Acer yangbiense]|uniref:Photolyase/cryptochrome alpha/beta domain-containing protein n=1 Tax=Acer yangbiense TaxID=1000413 RepID=A0A5C7IIT9_9ROSI|nr:hypothetical protein EZV62_003930 [Acer yangbiense]